MCQNSNHRHPIQCIIPSHMLDHILLHGSPQQREIALKNYTVSHSFRTARAILSALPTPLTALPHVGTPPGPQRTIYDTHHQWHLPGKVVRTEGQSPVEDPAVNEAYDGLGATFTFYLTTYQRNSVDNNGLPLRATVHYGTQYDNAFWNGSQMVFGDGDGQLFNRFTIALDVIAHELTHGVTQTDANLIYQDQSGALNESISDVFGSLVKQFILGQTADEADWLIGKGLFTENVQGVALRSLAEPGTAYDDPVLGKDPQPSHMKDYNTTPDDNGGVHINSGIPNHAFYLVAKKIGGNAWEKAGRIWYHTLHDRILQPNTDFQAFSHATTITAAQMYGTGSSEEQAVKDAWEQVGVIQVPAAAPARKAATARKTTTGRKATAASQQGAAPDWQAAAAGRHNGGGYEKIVDAYEELGELLGISE